jgi:hypothetical protein
MLVNPIPVTHHLFQSINGARSIMFPFIQAARIGVKVDCQSFKLHKLLSAQNPAIKLYLVHTLQLPSVDTALNSDIVKPAAKGCYALGQKWKPALQADCL